MITWYPVYPMTAVDSLQRLGWRPFFQSQVADCDGRPARVLNVQRGRVDVAHEAGTEAIEMTALTAAMAITVGDWVLIDQDTPRIMRRLDRFGFFQRRAPGTAGMKEGVRYQMYHALALLAVAWLGTQVQASAVHIAGWAFVAGILPALQARRLRVADALRR